MSNFTEEELAILKCIGDISPMSSGGIVTLQRGTLIVTATKTDNGDCEIYCADDEYTIQVQCVEQRLESALKAAFNKYRENSSIVWQTRQFISNAEDDIRKRMETAK